MYNINKLFSIKTNSYNLLLLRPASTIVMLKIKSNVNFI